MSFDFHKYQDWIQGNPGSMQFLIDLHKSEVPFSATENVMKVLTKAKKIRGKSLYVLWDNLCDRKIKTVDLICAKVPIQVLEDACSRQDYSGRDLIAPYLNK